jgi:NADH dehydrogenase
MHVTGIDAHGVDVTDDATSERERIAARTVLWAAGVAASPLGQVLQRRVGAPLDKIGRVIVEPDLSVPGHPEILVIGDLAHSVNDTGAPLPGVAPVAMQQGRYVANLIVRRLRGEESPPFRYVDRGSLATIGRAAAVADFGRLHLSGLLAWLAWLFIHLLYLVEFDNRVLVLVQWAWNYFTRNRGARLITGDVCIAPREIAQVESEAASGSAR